MNPRCTIKILEENHGYLQSSGRSSADIAVRESILGQEDRNNVSYRLREGWELVRAEELPPEFSLPSLESGRHAGVVYNEGLLLAKIPTETAEERRTYYAGKTQERNEALDNTIYKDQEKDRRYVKYDSKRESSVRFGKS